MCKYTVFHKIVLFFSLHFFSFSQGMQTRERGHCARSVFPFIKKKKIKFSLHMLISKDHKQIRVKQHLIS